MADRFAWVCAFWLHLALFAVLNSAAFWKTIPPSPPEPISVDILEDPVLPAPSAAPEALPDDLPGTGQAGLAAPDETPMPGSTGSEGGWVTATTLLAGSVLSNPGSAQARAALATLTGEDKSEQLCALEAMEQVRKDRPGFRPTRLAPHAFRNSRRRGELVDVSAGALRSDGVWYEIAYRCRLNTGGTEITAFEYALGAKIDRSLWEDYGLAPVH
ncbi:DUF930 domain-containing protein [Roseibium sp. M-1]